LKIFVTAHETAVTPEVTLLEDVAYPQYVHWFPETYARVSTGLHYPPARVAEMALPAGLRAQVRAAAAQGGRSAFLLAAGNTNFVGGNFRRIKPEGRLAYTYKLLPLSLTNIYAARIAQDLGCADHISTDATACASSIKTLMDAISLIRLHGYERVAILAVEDQVNIIMLEFFGETRAVLTRAEMDEHHILPSAFDPANRGFFIGQGAAFALLETEASMRAGNRTPLAELKSATVVAERHGNAVGQREDGAGFRDAITEALRLAEVDAASVDLVKTHGTGTRSNNAAESAGIEAVFGDTFLATSYKQRIGHTMGPSGLIELILALRDAREGIARGIPNRTGGDERYLMEDRRMPVRRVLALASGMGNVYGAALCDLA